MSEVLQAQQLVQTHYENFPVAPFFLPRTHRKAIAMIYAFARRADDIADEGDDSPAERLAQLAAMGEGIEQIEQKTLPTEPFFQALALICEKHTLPLRLFKDLLHAFRQDVIKAEYDNYEQVLDYCQYSANPIGALLLHLSGNATEQNLQDSNHICTALQLINFLQDVESDWQDRRRLYLPIDALATHGLTPANFLQSENTEALQACVQQQWQRAADQLKAGAPLGKRLSGRFGLNIRLVIEGGATILQGLSKRKHPLADPRLKFHNWLLMGVRALSKRSHLDSMLEIGYDTR